MNSTWIGRHKPITIRPHHKVLYTPNLAESSLSVTSLGYHDQWRLSYRLHYRVSCLRACAERTSWVVLVNIWAMSCAEVVWRDLLVAYPVIEICAYMETIIWRIETLGLKHLFIVNPKIIPYTEGRAFLKFKMNPHLQWSTRWVSLLSNCNLMQKAVSAIALDHSAIRTGPHWEPQLWETAQSVAKP